MKRLPSARLSGQDCVWLSGIEDGGWEEDSMSIVTKPLNATLINHTGTMARFRATDLPFLPSGRRECEIELPDRRVVAGRFGPNRRTPNVTAPVMARWIKSWLPRTNSCHVVVHPVGTADKIRL